MSDDFIPRVNTHQAYRETLNVDFVVEKFFDTIQQLSSQLYILQFAFLRPVGTCRVMWSISAIN
jgi:hypothetical protein